MMDVRSYSYLVGSQSRLKRLCYVFYGKLYRIYTDARDKKINDKKIIRILYKIIDNRLQFI